MHYTRTAMVLHWLMALLILVALAMGLYMVDLRISPQKLKLYSWHKWLGVTILLLAAVRLIWRLRQAPPPLPAMPAWQRRAASATHIALYALFFAIPLSGWIFSSAKGFQTVYLGLIPLPDLVSKDESLAAIVKQVHFWAGMGLVALVALHIAAAVKHQFVDRDGLIGRMLPARAATTVLAAGLLALVTIAAPVSAPAAAPLKLVADKSSIAFSFSQLGVPMKGRFTQFDASVDFDPKKPEATRATFTVDLQSVDLGAADYNAETRSTLWLNANMFPKARFVAKRVVALPDGRFEASGTLDIKGVAHPVQAQFRFTDGAQPVVEGSFSMKRLLWKIGDAEWRDTSVVADEVVVRFRFVTAR